MDPKLMHIALEQTAKRWDEAYPTRNKHFNVIEISDDKLTIAAQELMVFTFTREELEKILKDRED